MIEVRMGKNDNIDLGQLLKLKRGRDQSFWADSESWQTNADARGKHRISENLDAEKIDKHGRVTNPCERDLRIAPRCRVRLRKCGRYRPPAFGSPFAEQMTEPAPYP